MASTDMRTVLRNEIQRDVIEIHLHATLIHPVVERAEIVGCLGKTVSFHQVIVSIELALLGRSIFRFLESIEAGIGLGTMTCLVGSECIEQKDTGTIVVAYVRIGIGTQTVHV